MINVKTKGVEIIMTITRRKFIKIGGLIPIGVMLPTPLLSIPFCQNHDHLVKVKDEKVAKVIDDEGGYLVPKEVANLLQREIFKCKVEIESIQNRGC